MLEHRLTSALFREHLEATELIPHDASVVIGVSGGADSMVLLHLLAHLRGQSPWLVRLHAAHLDHLLRGSESEADAALVEETCWQLEVPCTVKRADVRRLAGQGAGVEEMARRVRYLFFEQVCLRTSSKYVAVAHNADDHVETVLHRMIRGTGLRGLAGIPARRRLHADSEMQLVRPLLRFSRQAIREFAMASGIVYREDSSNELLAPTRNRIRHRLLPELRQELNPQVDAAILRLSEQARWVQDYLEDAAERAWASLAIAVEPQRVVLDADALSRASKPLQAEVVRQAYRRLGLGEQELAFVHLAKVVELLQTSEGGHQVTLPHGLVAEKRYHQLILHFPEQWDEAEAVAMPLSVPGEVFHEQLGVRVKAKVASAWPLASQAVHEHSRLEEYLDADRLIGQLTVRGRRPGDRFVPLGAPGEKTIADFLNELKVPPRVRAFTPILADEAGPVWVVGYRLADRVKITETTARVVHVRAQLFPHSETD